MSFTYFIEYLCIKLIGWSSQPARLPTSQLDAHLQTLKYISQLKNYTILNTFFNDLMIYNQLIISTL